MSKFVVVVLPDEKKAYEALHAIKALHEEGTVTYYGSAIVERKADGKLDVKQAADEGPLGLATGSLVGGLVGLFGGPVGAAVGFATGGMVGSVRDVVHAGVSEDFVEKVTRDLEPGKFAVIAELSEEWATPLDMRMATLGAEVVRQDRDEFVDDQIEKEVDAARSELERRKGELSAKAEQTGAKLEKRVDDARHALQEKAVRARERFAQKKQEMSAKIKALKEQGDKADAELQRRIEHRIAEIRTDLQAREQKLDQASKLIEQAFHR